MCICYFIMNCGEQFVWYDIQRDPSAIRYIHLTECCWMVPGTFNEENV